MKKFLITLTILVFSFSAYALQTSVVVGTGSNTSSVHKTTNIETSANKDVNIIETKGKDWDESLTQANSKFEQSKTRLNTVVQNIISESKVFLLTETDPGTKTYAHKNVPICTGTKSRLTYEGGQWHCKEPIPCGSIDSKQAGWIQDPDTGKCRKPTARWVIGDWTPSFSLCSSTRQTQTRSVSCVMSNNTVDKSNCSAPEPLTSRPCAKL